MEGLDVFGFLHGVSPWIWIALGIALGVVEMATMSFFLIWPGLAAAATGLVLWAAPDLSGTAQVLVFAALSVAFTFAGRAAMRRGGAAPAEGPALNRRNARLLGRRGVALEAFVGGEGVVEIDGVRWRAATDPAATLRPGDGVRVRAVDGMVLLVVPDDGAASGGAPDRV